MENPQSITTSILSKRIQLPTSLDMHQDLSTVLMPTQI
jgi:hypothetical protein